MRLAAVVALACACSSGGPAQPTKIDNGVRSIYSLDLEAVTDKRAALDRAAAVMRKRFAAAKIVGHAFVEGDTVVVDLAAADQETLARARELIGRTGKLEIKAVDSDAPLMRDLYGRASAERPDGIKAINERWESANTRQVDYHLEAANREEVVDEARARALGCLRGPPNPDGRVLCQVSGRMVLEEYLKHIKRPDDRQFAFEHSPPAWRSYYVERKPAVTNEVIANAIAVPDPATNRPSIRIELDTAGTRAFAELTRRQTGKKVALILDDRITSAPIIMEPITGGKASVTLGEDAKPEHARELAIVLRSGALPTPVREESRAELRDGKVVVEPAP